MRGNPRLLLGAVAPRLVVVEPKPGQSEPGHRREAQAFSLMALVLGLAYLIWLGRLVLASRGSPMSFFFVAEILSYLLLCLLSYSTWRLLRPIPGNPESKARLSVDIFVPCCGEPVEIIETTLKAVQRITYHPLEVYVLDDGDFPGSGGSGPILGILLPFAAEAGLPRTDSKGGNLNFGLSHSRGELDPGVGRGPGAGAGNPEPPGKFFPPAAGGLCPEQATLFLAGKVIPSTIAIRCFTRLSS